MVVILTRTKLSGVFLLESERPSEIRLLLRRPSSVLANANSFCLWPHAWVAFVTLTGIGIATVSPSETNNSSSCYSC